MPVSNGSLLDLACTAAELADGWTDGDTGEAVSTSETNAPVADPMATVWSFDTNTSADTNDYAGRLKDIGSLDGIGNRIVLSAKLYFDLIGTFANNDVFKLECYRSDLAITIAFASDGLFIHNGVTWNEIGTDLVVQDTWQEWTADIDLSGGVANAVFDLYLDKNLVASAVDCSRTGTWPDGSVQLYLNGFTTDNCIAYLDWLKIGDGFAAEGNPLFFSCNF